MHQVRARLRRAAGLAHNAVTVARWPTGDDSRAHQVTRGIRASVLRRPDDRLQAQIAMIERRRRELEARRDLVEMLDFGAGSNFANPAAALGTDPARTVRTPVGELCRRASRGPEWGRLMAAITRSTRPGAVLEMGACMGLSACYFGAALRANGGGRIVTIEGAPALASIAEETVREVGLHDVVEVRTGTFAELLGPTLDELGTTDLAFVDGHHDEEATLDYWELLRQRLASDAVVIFDDVRWSAGMRRAWQTVAHDPSLQLAVDLGGMGVVVLGSGPALRLRARYR